MAREIGTALAVLGLYLLTILTPLHSARASQLAFEELGYGTITAGWVFCDPAAIPEHDGDISLAKCPAAGIGKPLADPASLESTTLDLHGALLAAPRPPVPLRVALAPIAPPAGPRAPPEPV